MSDPRDEAIETLLRRQFDGPVPDDGFAERVMRRLPRRRRARAWQSAAGILIGAVACWLSLPVMPPPPIGWHEGSTPSASAVILLLVVAGMSLLAAWWGIAEADDR